MASAAPAGLCIIAGDAAFARGLTNAFRIHRVKRFVGRGSRTPLKLVAREQADICVYAFAPADVDATDFVERETRAIASDPAATKIFLELVSPAAQGPVLAEAQRRNVQIAALANASNGQLIALLSKFLRWGPARMMTKSGEVGLKGYLAIANAIGKIADHHVIRAHLRDAEGGPVRGAQGVGAEAQAILNDVRWNEQALPRLLKMPFDADAVREFADGFVYFLSYPSWGRVPYSLPIDWSLPGPNRSWQSYFLGLEFVNPMLAYWYGQRNATSRHGDRTAIEDLLTNRGIDADALLQRAGAVICDFVRSNAPDAPAARRAWHEGTVSRRLRTLLSYLLCCKRISERGGSSDAESVVLAHRGAIDCIEFLRSDSVYIKAGNHGVRQDAMLIVASLLLSGGDEGRRYLKDGLARLKRWQLDEALSDDGVWLENSFGYHCLVMGTLSNLAADLRTAGASGLEPLLDALERMCRFVEATIKIDGTPPLIGDTEPKYYLRSLIGARRLLRDFRADDDEDAPIRAADFAREADTYCFPDAGYFVSHSSRTMDKNGSNVILYANLSTPKHKHSDDLSVIFTHGAVDLLIDGGTYNKEVGDQVRNAARFDPGSHNTYRVNGKGYSLRSVKERNRPAGLSRKWQGEDWAAAEGFNTAYPDAEIRRLAIHLKSHHALLIVDRLRSKTRALVEFEQFWHVAPQFAAQPAPDSGLTFASPADGNLLVAFDDGEARLAVEHGGPDNPIAWLMIGDERTVPTPYIRRARTLSEGMMAAAFQWAPHADTVSISTLPGRGDAFEFESHGAGFACAFAYANGQLRRVR